MKLSELSITNYRALKDVKIPLSKFGCLIGENNSGKSFSFLRARFIDTIPLHTTRPAG